MMDAMGTTLETPVAREARNTYGTALAVVGGLSWVLALMLWSVLESITDYTTYDVRAASALASWIEILVLGGTAAAIGAMVIAGVRQELRRARRN